MIHNSDFKKRVNLSVAILAQEPLLVRTCTMFFPFRSASGFVLYECLQPSFVVSHLFSWHVRVMERMCQYLPNLPPLRIWVLQTALFLTFKEQDTAPQRWRKKSTKFTYGYRSSCKTRPGSTIASKRFPRQWPRMMRKSRILNKWLAALQPVLPHWKRMQRPSPVDPARQDLGKKLGHSDGSTATGSFGSHGPGSSDDNRNTRRRLDTFPSPEDEQSRSAVLQRFPCEQYHKGINYKVDQ